MATPKAEKKTEVRILVDTWIDGVLVKPNTVLACDPASAKHLVSSGVADDSAAAVKAAKAE